MYLLLVCEKFHWPFKMFCNPEKLILSIPAELMGTLEFLISSGEFIVIIPEFNYEFLFKTH